MLTGLGRKRFSEPSQWELILKEGHESMCLSSKSRLKRRKDAMRKAAKVCLHRKPGRKNVLGALARGKVKSYSNLEGTQKKNTGHSGSLTE